MDVARQRAGALPTPPPCRAAAADTGCRAATPRAVRRSRRKSDRRSACVACPARTAARGSSSPSRLQDWTRCMSNRACRPGESAVRYADGTILPTSARRPRSRRPHGLPGTSAAPDPTRRTIRRSLRAPSPTVTSAPAPQARLIDPVLGLLPDDQHAAAPRAPPSTRPRARRRVRAAVAERGAAIRRGVRARAESGDDERRGIRRARRRRRPARSG